MKKNKQILSIILSLVLSISTVSSSMALAPKVDKYNMEISSNLIAMTQEEEVNLSFETQLKTADGISWYYGDKQIGQYKTYNEASQAFDGNSYITVSKAPEITQGELKATLKFGLLFNKEDTESNLYMPYIGEKSIIAKDAKGNAVATSEPVKLSVFDSYQTTDELHDAIKEIEKTASKDRYVKLDSYGTTILGKSMDYMVIAKSKEDVEEFLSETNKQMLQNPQALLEEIKTGKSEYKIPLLFSSIHASEQPNSDIITELARAFAKEKEIDFSTYIKERNASAVLSDETPVQKKLDVADVLDNFILVFSFTQNPDGDNTDVRENAYGFDPNRDNGYQVHPEGQAMAALINKYNPLVFLDFHGFIEGFLIEPCTPPHDPNTEVDLLMPGLLSSAHAIGKAGVAQSKYDTYEIPLLDYKEGWDDATSAYTATYALYHGVIGHTVEVPQKNEESFKAGLYGGFGAISNALENKDAFMANKLEVYKRGIEKTEAKSASDALTGKDGNPVGRIKGENPTFFPDYYIIPASGSLQKNAAEAYNIVGYLERNGVDVQKLSKSAMAASVNYPQGSYVVNMAQAKRGYANHVLSKGSDESAWGEMYAEIVMNFPATRGFDCYEIYDNKLKLETTEIVKAEFEKPYLEKTPYQMVKNNSSQAVAAVNKALSQGEKVYMIQDGAGKGNFVFETKDFAKLYKTYNLEVMPYAELESEKQLKALKVYNTGEYQAQYVLEKVLGFEMTDNIKTADVIIDAGGNIEGLGQKPFISVGGDSIKAITDSKVLKGLESTTTNLYHEGLMKADIDTSSMLSSSYESKDNMYSSSGTWIEKLPEGFSSIASIEDSKVFYISGWWPAHEYAQGKTMIAQGSLNSQSVVLIAGNPFNKARNAEFTRWVSNAIYMAQ
ncbi:MAG: hypothetical protein WBH44_01050 [Proteocatella sp.]